MVSAHTLRKHQEVQEFGAWKAVKQWKAIFPWKTLHICNNNGVKMQLVFLHRASADFLQMLLTFISGACSVELLSLQFLTIIIIIKVQEERNKLCFSFSFAVPKK